jgi:tetratricopeptide (TPR) repeat protein
MVKRASRRALGVSCAAIALILLAVRPVAGQEVSAWIEPGTVGLGQTAELVVEIELGAFDDVDEPRIPAIPGASIVGRSREARVVLSGGRISRRSVFRYTLLPTSPGAIRIDALRVKLGDRTVTTPPMRLVVLPTGDEPLLGRERGRRSDGPPPVFAVTRIDRNRAWVGEQITLTFAFYHDPSHPLAESPDYEPPATPGFWRMEIDPEPVVSLERIGGRAYHVQKFRYALFALRAGELTIGGARVRLVEADQQRWWQPGRPRTIETEPLRVAVEALPPAPEGFAGAVGRYHLEGGVRPRGTAAGTPVELELKVHGTGNANAIGPPILPAWPDIEVRPPAVDANTEPGPEGVRGDKTFRFLLVPEAPGRMSLGEARLPYFDPTAGEYRTETLRLGEIAVTPAPAMGGAASIARRSPRGPTLWPARTPLSRRGEDRGLAGEPWTWVALAGPWTVWLAAAGVRGAWRRRPRDPARAAIANLADARRALVREGSAALGRAERALEDAVVARWGSEAAASRDRRRALVEAGAPPALVEDVETARAALAAARFAGGSIEDAVAAVTRVESRLMSRTRLRAPKTALVVLVVLVAGSVSSLATAPALAQDPEAPPAPGADPAADAAREAWGAANAAYRAGDFRRAAMAYDALLAEWSDPLLEADLAAALWREGRGGEALAHYLRALDLAPRARTVRSDLDRLRRSLGDPPDARPPWARALARAALDELVLLLLVVNTAAFALFLFGRARPGLRPFAVAGFLAIVALAGVTALHAWTIDPTSWVVAGGDAEVRAVAEPPPGTPPIATLREGSVLRVLERGRAAWRVQPSGLPAGWVARDRIVPVDSRRRSHAE